MGIDPTKDMKWLHLSEIMNLDFMNLWMMNIMVIKTTIYHIIKVRV